MSVPAAFLGVILIWSTTPLAIQWSSEGWGYLTGVSARMLLGAVLCFALVKLMKNELPWHRQARLTYITAGIGVYGAMMSTYWGAQFIPSGLVAVIFGLSPIVMACMATLILKEQGFTPGKVLGMLLGIVGLVVIFESDISHSTLAWQGIAAMLFATLLHTSSSVFVKKIAADLPALSVTCGALLVAAPAYALTWWLVDGAMPTHASLRAGLAIAYLGVFGSLIGFTLFYYVLKNVEANRVSLITLITPVIALLLGQRVNHEVISLTVWLGTGCIITALVLHQWADSFIRRLRYARLKAVP
jgi:drug/metabolite transporter (DMT)-like permease